MNPSSLSTCATAIFSFDAGMSTVARSMRLALRIRVSMSARLSVIMMGSSSPARLLDARNQPVVGHAAEADPADAELAVHGPGSPAQLAAQTNADSVARAEFLGLAFLGEPVGVEKGQVLAESCVLCVGCHVVGSSVGYKGRFGDRPLMGSGRSLAGASGCYLSPKRQRGWVFLTPRGTACRRRGAVRG